MSSKAEAKEAKECLEFPRTSGVGFGVGVIEFIHCVR